MKKITNSTKVRQANAKINKAAELLDEAARLADEVGDSYSAGCLDAVRNVLDSADTFVVDARNHV